MEIEELNKLTVIKLKELAKVNDIHKGISKYKKKDELINYIFNEMNAKKERESVNNFVTDVFEKISSDNIKKEEINEIVDNFVDKLTNDCDEIKLDLSPKYYYLKQKEPIFSIKTIESLLEKKLNFGDIIQFDDYRAKECYIVSYEKNELIKVSGDISDDICIPYEITKYFENPIETYKDIHNYFYGIELSRTNKYIVDNFGDFNAPEDWKYYYVNQYIYENEFHIDIGMNDFIRLTLNINEPNNKYLTFVNSIDYVKKLYNMNQVDTENYGLYVTLKNEDNENLTDEETNFIYNIEIPDYSLINIEFQINYYEIRFTYLRKEKEKMIQFINNYYFEKSYTFVQEVEGIIHE